jgi:hypothetical protein
MEGDKLPWILVIVVGSSILIGIIERVGIRKKHHH